MLGRPDEPEPVGLAGTDVLAGDGLAEQIEESAGVLEVLGPDVVQPRGREGLFFVFWAFAGKTSRAPGGFLVLNSLPKGIPV